MKPKLTLPVGTIPLAIVRELATWIVADIPGKGITFFNLEDYDLTEQSDKQPDKQGTDRSPDKP